MHENKALEFSLEFSLYNKNRVIVVLFIVAVVKVVVKWLQAVAGKCNEFFFK